MYRKILAVLTAAVLSAAMAVPSMAATKLDTPEEVYWDGADETDAVWAEVEDAAQYEVYLYRVSDSGSRTKVGEAKTKKTKYAFARKMDQEGDYVFKVRALAKGKDYTDSAWSEESDASYISEEFAQWVKDGMKKQDPNTSGPGAKQGDAGSTGAVLSGTGLIQPGWRQDGKGWWWAIHGNGDAWYYNCWQWLDGNQDGIAECYCFGPDGYIYTDTATPDGYIVNADGAWTVDGVVQTVSTK